MTEVLIVLILICAAPIKIAAWIFGLVISNVVDGFHRGWESVKPFGKV